MSNTVAILDVNEAVINDVKGGYEVVLKRRNGDDIVVYQSPEDPLWEQLLNEGIVEP